MSKGTIFNFAVDTASAVDADKGVILGVAVITAGPARGHFDWASGNPLYADAKTLQEVKSCAETYSGGLKVKFNHGSGVGDIVGSLRNFRIDGDILRADFYALQTSPNRAYLFEIAATMPESFGLSISFSGKPEENDDKSFARCAEIYSADFVDEPAANPNGLFQRGEGKLAEPAQYKPTNSEPIMEDEKKNDPIADLSASVAALLGRLEALEAKMPKEDEKPEEMKSDIEDEKSEEMNSVIEKAALAALKEYTKQFGAPPASAPSSEAKREDKKSEKNFEAIVAEKSIELKSKADAIRWAVAAHPELHKSYLARVAAGETINL
jgi:hypothetical protein